MKKILRRLAMVFVLAIAAVVVFFLFQLIQKTFIRAADVAPGNVEIVDITENTAVITWTTDRDSQAVVEYGSSPTSLTFFAPETEKATHHSVPLTLLSADATYYFHVKVGDKVFDNAGVPWTFTTKSGKSTVEVPIPAQTENQVDSQVLEDFSFCEEELDCEAIKEKIKTRECLAIHYSRCLIQETATE